MSSKKKPTIVEELYTGYLLKSPPPSALNKNTRGRKPCFFVLSKTSEDSYQLTYYANHEKRDKPSRVIDISNIILLFIGPEAHQKWDWIQKNFNCAPSSVLFLKVEDDTSKHSREYFLIGKNSDDVNGWFNALFEVMKTQQSRNTLQHDMFRSASQPVRMDFSKVRDRWSAPELTFPSRKLSEPPVSVMHKIPVIENTDEKDGKQDESPVNSRIYMTMASVESATDTSDDSLLDCVIENFNDMKMPQTSTESGEQREDHRDFKQSISVTGRCASTELDNSVSQRHQMQDSRRDGALSPEAVEGIQKCLKGLSRDEAKLLFQRFSGLIPD